MYSVSGGENYFGPEIEVESHGRKIFSKVQVSGELWSILPDHISWLYKIYSIESQLFELLSSECS